jgi:hypothetical protein
MTPRKTLLCECQENSYSKHFKLHKSVCPDRGVSGMAPGQDEECAVRNDNKEHGAPQQPTPGQAADRPWPDEVELFFNRNTP